MKLTLERWFAQCLPWLGALADLQPWLKAHPHRIDTQFKDKVLMPGLIDPRMHPILGAIAFQTVWTTPELGM